MLHQHATPTCRDMFDLDTKPFAKKLANGFFAEHEPTRLGAGV
ncbi:hypothetical protein LRHMDP2_1552 [Lacticaseibacillus rhamnosus LRHMDP2]|uniref:Uncharacterized protein n=1 Tax=Lacticaseibacillus rhamnosus LRHMDP3 TaxID=1203259 RepID=A0AB33XT62_LACRH|nr:hypothetical protein LRHMDP3_2125 [Lacticaseibacillus rhamnosus LRHMDP3]EKS51147.1 hypothetical protein LRHMDP2_1552 [Lacticaseibacillus rhamnosus LRHMDP2]